jgi:hypothetical protein
MLCGEALLVKLQPEEIGARLLRCRAWTCPNCHDDRKRGLQAQAHRGHPTRFITLTVNPAYFTTPLERAQRLVIAWRKVRLAAMKKYKLKALPFLAVFEATRKGEPHLHILARFKWIAQDWLSKQMEEEIGAWCVDIRSVKDRVEIRRYIAKYVGKSAHHFGTMKRYWASRDYEIAGKDDDGALIMPTRFEVRHDLSFTGFIAKLARLGCAVTETRHWAIFHGPPPPGLDRHWSGWMATSV